MSSIFNKNPGGGQAGGRPPAAVEISPEGVLAASRPASRKRGAESAHGNLHAFVPLPPGALVPGIEEPNLREPEAVAAAIRSALDEVSPRIARRHRRLARHAGPRLRPRLRFPSR